MDVAYLFVPYNFTTLIITFILPLFSNFEPQKSKERWVAVCPLLPTLFTQLKAAATLKKWASPSFPLLPTLSHQSRSIVSSQRITYRPPAHRKPQANPDNGTKETNQSNRRGGSSSSSSQHHSQCRSSSDICPSSIHHASTAPTKCVVASCRSENQARNKCNR